MHNIELFLRVAKEASLLGGLVLKEFYKSEGNRVMEKGEKDVYSLADKLSEERIREHILKWLPDHKVVGEEDGGSTDGDYVWFIDPLDGTKNYIAGFPVFGTSVGLLYKGRPIVGAVYTPVFDSLYWAYEGGGAYKNGKRISVGEKERVKQCYVAYGYPSRAKRDLNAYWNIFREVFDNVSAMRRPGAAAVDLCLLAEGVFDGLLEFELNPWDVVAGVIIAKESGARVSLTKGFSMSTDVYAGNQTCYPFIERVIKLNIENFEAYNL
ncbi:MAG: inositol monophosphatase [Aquificaceae bacterium]|nr:inositol monophosphatase [Aquificaceae bacterium]MCS7307473.1 inositol monophosphatase [Aquificaceae bacterium]MCX8076900.1 inositol monophosphatase [Aquificaceae bacterium]MDW8095852.1 inositol monophosphatase family protein [Aquificaceae bacterium]MDW8433542.1 inositol monophosphatase family protein [Aquificaceae bacterium]